MFTNEKYFVVCPSDSGNVVWVLDPDDKRQWEGKDAHPVQVHMLGGICGYGLAAPPLVEAGDVDAVKYIKLLSTHFKPWIVTVHGGR